MAGRYLGMGCIGSCMSGGRLMVSNMRLNVVRWLVLVVLVLSFLPAPILAALLAGPVFAGLSFLCRRLLSTFRS